MSFSTSVESAVNDLKIAKSAGLLDCERQLSLLGSIH